MEKLGFAVACMKYFGRQEGQSLSDFAKEVKGLTIADKREIAPVLSAELKQEVIVT